MRWGFNSTHSTQGVDLERQQRLEEWLNALLHRQMFINNSREIVVYRLSEYGGFGNVIRGYFTSMLLVMLYDTCLKGGDTTRISSLVDSFQDYLRLFFFSPFPNIGSPFERNDKEGYWRIGKEADQAEWVFNPFASFESQQSIIPLWHNRSVDLVVTSYYDATIRIHSGVYDAKLKSMGFLPSHASDVSSSQRTKEMHSILLRLLFNPSYDLCSKINNYISQLRSAYSIGIQLRMGGQLSNMKDAVFLDLNRVKEVIQEVKQQASLMKPRRVIAFLSTDSSAVQEYVTQVLSPSITVLLVDDYQIGHSATTYGRKGKQGVWEGATKRAIMDLMILKECDLLYVTHNSSFGGFQWNCNNLMVWE